MKKVLFILMAAFFSWGAYSQEPTYLTFELMKVEEGMGGDYLETETFWEKIHQQRVNNGDIVGWDLWALSPSGTGQGHQYMTVALYNDPVKMMGGGTDLDEILKAAYPKMSQFELDKKMDQTAKSRDLAVVIYLQQIASAGGDFEMPLGTLAQINFMKAKPGQSDTYEEMESSMFKGMHDQRIAAGGMAMWGLMRNMLGYPTEAYASHITVDMFKDWDQYFNASTNIQWTPEQQEAYNQITEMRDLKSTVFATLVKKVR
ncbi:MAG: hypothetical protein KJO90_07780 [Eudoraea sp.]|nr:hypothetical protein [Eudoraea sp.]